MQFFSLGLMVFQNFGVKYTGTTLSIDKNIVTGNGPAASKPYANIIIKLLKKVLKNQPLKSSYTVDIDNQGMMMGGGGF